MRFFEASEEHEKAKKATRNAAAAMAVERLALRQLSVTSAALSAHDIARRRRGRSC